MPGAAGEAHSQSRFIQLSTLSSDLLTVIGTPNKESPRAADILTPTSDHPSEPYTPGTIWASEVASDALARFLDPRNEAPWTPEDLGRRERVVENLWMANELLRSDGKL